VLRSRFGKLAAFVLQLPLFHLFVLLTAGKNSSTMRVLVTGANRGIGFAIVKAVLAHSPVTEVVLATRDLSTGRAAVEGLEDDEQRRRCSVVQLNVDSDESVAAAAETVRQSGKRLYAIVNNAGCLAQSPEKVIETNLFGVKRVCDAFFPLLEEDGGRVVMISSGAASNFLSKCAPERVQHMVGDDVTWEDIKKLSAEFLAGGSGFGSEYDVTWTPYGFSKAALNSLTIALSREHPALVINACSPGMIRTDLFADYAAQQGKSIDESIAAFGPKDPSESTVAPLALLFRPREDLKGPGLYYGSDGLRSPFARYRQPNSPEYDGSQGR
jgi:NAD(P)-dependent dehydrogenase (short-subunit alcohol dehydrogenase family)